MSSPLRSHPKAHTLLCTLPRVTLASVHRQEVADSQAPLLPRFCQDSLILPFLTRPMPSGHRLCLHALCIRNNRGLKFSCYLHGSISALKGEQGRTRYIDWGPWPQDLVHLTVECPKGSGLAHALCNFSPGQAV